MSIPEQCSKDDCPKDCESGERQRAIRIVDAAIKQADNDPLVASLLLRIRNQISSGHEPDVAGPTS